MKKGYFGDFGGCFVPELLMPPLMELEEAMKNIVKQVGEVMSSGNINFQMFWKNYNQHKADIRLVVDQNGFTQYIPKQIKISLEGALKQWALLEVTGCDGYAVLKKWSKRSL